ncbi:MAG: hypothetical protein OQK01_11855 [Xanthomonadales bacterium]|jgi:hypothetical protein|nr:hypothetical protein [Xanthomonadales bacterium]
MRKSQIALILVTSLVLSPLALAKKNAPDPLATVIPGGCDLVQIAPYGTSLLASWGWENGTDQTKFGGDAEYRVEATTIDDTYDLKIKFHIEQYVPGTSPDDYAGTLVYRCSTAVSEESGECNGSVLGIRDAIRVLAADELGVEPEDITTLFATLKGVFVKAMNPGRGGGRQNYDHVDVCDN